MTTHVVLSLTLSSTISHLTIKPTTALSAIYNYNATFIYQTKKSQSKNNNPANVGILLFVDYRPI